MFSQTPSFFCDIRFSFFIYPFFSVFVGSKTDIGENLWKIFVSKSLSPNISQLETDIFKNIRRRIISKTDNRYFTRIRGASVSTSLRTKTTSHPAHPIQRIHHRLPEERNNCNNIEDRESGQGERAERY